MPEIKTSDETTKEFSINETCRSDRLLKNLAEIVQTHQSKEAKYLGMSILHLIEDEYDETLDYLKKLIENHPKIPSLHRRSAEIFIYRENYKQAIFHLEKVLELDEKDIAAKIWLCLSYYKTKESKKAESCMKDLRFNVFVLRATTNNWL